MESDVGAKADRRHVTAAAYPDVERWIGYMEFVGRSERTIYDYERKVAPLLRAYPDVAFVDFTADHIQRTLGKIPARSRHISRSIYNSWFKWGTRYGDHPGPNPMDKVPELTPGERRPVTIFTEGEVALLESLPMPDGALWALMFSTLIRRADALKIQRKHIDLDRMRLVIFNGKGGKDAVIPFGPKLAAVIADLDLTVRLDPEDYLWSRPKLNTSRRTPISRSQFDIWYRAGIEAAGVRYLRPHTTRHTGHWILKHVEEMDLEMRQLVLRHKSPETTVRQYPVTDVEDVAAFRSRVTA